MSPNRTRGWDGRGASVGKVAGYLDLRELLSVSERASTDLLNGIAYDAAHDRLFITGKWWPKLFEVKIVPRS